jgi:hypothetical protein
LGDDLVIRDNVADHRYEGVVGGRVVGWVEYRRFGTRTVIRHTVVRESCGVDTLKTARPAMHRIVGEAPNASYPNIASGVARFSLFLPARQRAVDTCAPPTANGFGKCCAHDAGAFATTAPSCKCPSSAPFCPMSSVTRPSSDFSIDIPLRNASLPDTAGIGQP